MCCVGASLGSGRVAIINLAQSWQCAQGGRECWIKMRPVMSMYARLYEHHFEVFTDFRVFLKI